VGGVDGMAQPNGSLAFFVESYSLTSPQLTIYIYHIGRSSSSQISSPPFQVSFSSVNGSESSRGKSNRNGSGDWVCSFFVFF